MRIQINPLNKKKNNKNEKSLEIKIRNIEFFILLFWHGRGGANSKRHRALIGFHICAKSMFFFILKSICVRSRKTSFIWQSLLSWLHMCINYSLSLMFALCVFSCVYGCVRPRLENCKKSYKGSFCS